MERSKLKDPSERLHQYMIRERQCWEEKSVGVSEEERSGKYGRWLEEEKESGCVCV